MTAPASATSSGYPTRGFDQPVRRDLGLVGFCTVAIGAAFVLSSESPATATGATAAVATCMAMYARLAMGRWRALAQVAGTGLLVWVLGAPPRLIALIVVSGVVASELIAYRSRRAEILRVGAWLAVVAGVTSLSGLAAAVPVPPRQALSEGIAAIIGGFLSAPLVLTLAPLAEALFGHITRLTMREWLSYEHPLLRRMASEAPGTFQHSVNVGVLADAAAQAIKADSLVARVSGLYHDVGKLNAPEYFIENQHGGNPHDDLEPEDSARILRAHVIDGVDLVTRHGMGQRIVDAVREHHGVGEMRVLRAKAVATGNQVSEDAYRYPGPRPRSKETGILMIADQLDATARSKPPADEAECDTLVKSTIERIVDEGQLDDSTLALSDLTLLQEAFSRALQGIYHRRLSYPASGDGAAPRRLALRARPRGSVAS